MIRSFVRASCLLVVLMVGGSCHRRPLMEHSGGLEVQVVMEVEDVLNVYAGVYNAGIDVPDIAPQVMQVSFFDVETHRLAAEGFIHQQGEDFLGRQVISGTLNITPGVYDVLCYNWDVSATQIRNEGSWDEIEAYTQEVPDHLYTQLQARGAAGRICYEPDHLMVAREKGVRIEAGCQRMVICTEASPVMDTYYLQVPLKNGQRIISVLAVMTGLSPSNKFARDERNMQETSGMVFEMVKSEDPDVLVEDRKVLCAVFNTFGKNAEAGSRLKIWMTTQDGRVYEKVIGMDEVFRTEDAIKRHWLLLEEVIELPDPLFPPDGEGGFNPGLDVWEDEYGTIVID